MKRNDTPNTMQQGSLLATILILAAFTAGCNPSAEKTEKAEAKATAVEFAQVKKETKEAVQEMKDYAYAEKAEFVAKMQVQLDELNRDLDELSAKVEKSSEAAKAEGQPKLKALREQTAKLNTQLDEAKNSTESTWNDVKVGFKKGFGELKEGFQTARQWASDKIAP